MALKRIAQCFEKNHDFGCLQTLVACLQISIAKPSVPQLRGFTDLLSPLLASARDGTPLREVPRIPSYTTSAPRL